MGKNKGRFFKSKKSLKYNSFNQSKNRNDDDNKDVSINSYGELRGERHEGSYKIEEIKKDPTWNERIIYPDDNTSVKRKYLILHGYLGTNYMGSQINPNEMTIEKVLERSLLLSGAISENNFGWLDKVSWTRTARTDKGVHAVSNCVALKLKMPLNTEENLRNNMNKFLPNDVRVHRVQRVTQGFSAKSACTGRTYQYVLPTFLLQSKENMDELVYKYINNDSNNDNNNSSSSNKNHPIFQLDILDKNNDDDNDDDNSNTNNNNNNNNHDSNDYNDILKSIQKDLCSYRVPTDRLALLQDALQCYVGTYPYHNFTKPSKVAAASVDRYMTDFIITNNQKPHLTKISTVTNITSSTTTDGTDTNNYHNIHEMEWICVQVKGQSFLINQIRKMVGAALEVARGSMSIDELKSALTSNKGVIIPRMPGLGLYLFNASFDYYNEKINDLISAGNYKGDSDPPLLDFQNDEISGPRLQSFAETMLWPHIEQKEHDSMHFLKYAISHKMRRIIWLNHVPKMGGAIKDTKEAWMMKRDRSYQDDIVNNNNNNNDSSRDDQNNNDSSSNTN